MWCINLYIYILEFQGIGGHVQYDSGKPQKNVHYLAFSCNKAKQELSCQLKQSHYLRSLCELIQGMGFRFRSPIQMPVWLSKKKNRPRGFLGKPRSRQAMKSPLTLGFLALRRLVLILVVFIQELSRSFFVFFFLMSKSIAKFYTIIQEEEMVLGKEVKPNTNPLAKHSSSKIVFSPKLVQTPFFSLVHCLGTIYVTSIRRQDGLCKTYL